MITIPYSREELGVSGHKALRGESFKRAVYLNFSVDIFLYGGERSKDWGRDERPLSFGPRTDPTPRMGF